MGGVLGSGLGVDALTLRLREFLLELFDAVVGDVVLFPRDQQPAMGGVGLQRFLRVFQLDLEVFHLRGEPIAGVLRGLPTILDILRPILVGQGIEKIGGHLGVGGIARDCYQARV